MWSLNKPIEKMVKTRTKRTLIMKFLPLKIKSLIPTRVKTKSLTIACSCLRINELAPATVKKERRLGSYKPAICSPPPPPLPQPFGLMTDFFYFVTGNKGSSGRNDSGRSFKVFFLVLTNQHCSHPSISFDLV